jgi:membrane protein DedA with SNARE-associated domain
LADSIIAQLGYVGIVAALVLGGLGLPIPEEAPILVGAVLAHEGRLVPAGAFAACLLGVIAGDFVVYGLGYWHGERVLNLPLTRRWISREREARFAGLIHRHGLKVLVACRFAPGVRSAAYLTAGILRLPPLRMLGFDLVAASLTTGLFFATGFFFSGQIQAVVSTLQRYAGLTIVAGVVAAVLYYRFRPRRDAAGGLEPAARDAAR